MDAVIMTYCLKNALSEKDPSMGDVIRLAGAEGFGVEVYGGGWNPDEDLRNAAESAVKVAESSGVRMPAYGSGTRLGHPDPRKSEDLMAGLKIDVEVCEILGAGVLTFPIIDCQPVPPDRPDADQGMYFDRVLPFIVDQAQEISGFAAERGVDLAVVNHCFLCYLGWHQKWICKLTDRPNFGAGVDPGNYLHYGHEEPASACELVGKWAKMARAGDVVTRPEEETEAAFKSEGRLPFFQPVVFGQGEIDQKACYSGLKRAGFDGVVSLKSAGRSEGGPLEAIRESMESLSLLLKDI
jgi:sugar phosphate isomerase/epimerase